jgi:TIR domain-containing protein
MTTALAGFRRRWPTLLAAAGIGAAAIVGALLTQPAALAGTESRSRAVFASLASAGIAAALIIPLTARRRYSSRNIAVVSGAIVLVLGIAAYVAGASSQRQCTLQYDGRPVLIGTQLTTLGQEYRRVNPQLPMDEVLRDAGGQTETVWTRASINRCRVTLGWTYFLWLPLLITALVSAVLAVPAGKLSVPAAQAPPATPAAAPVLRYDVFISYRHGEADVDVARQLLDALEADGYKVALDERDFVATASFLLEIERCIRESRHTVAIVSARYLESGNCEEEAIVTKVLDMSERRRRLIPFIIQKVEMPAWLFNLVGIDCTKPDALVDPIDKLKATLGKPLGEKAEGQV